MTLTMMVNLLKLLSDNLRNIKILTSRFFFAVGYVSPHLPFIQPTKYGDLYKKSDLVFSKQRTPPVNAPRRSIAHDWTELRNGYTDIPSKGPVSAQMEEDLIKSILKCKLYRCNGW